MMKKWNTVLDYLFIAAGALVMALGLNLFLVPNKIAAGGAGGVATILHGTLGIPVSVVVLGINIILFVVGYRSISKRSFLKTVAGTLFYSGFIQLTSNCKPLTDDMLLASVFGGVLVGAGIGLVVRRRASTGGTDFGAMLLHKAIPHISVAQFIMLIDSVVIVAAGLAFADYTIMLYAVISLYISAKLTDAIVEGGDFAKCAFIISSKSEEISRALMEHLKRGVTGLNGRGVYKNREIMVLMCIVKRNELPRLKSVVSSIDENAFIILSEVREVLGEGFKRNQQVF